MMKPAKAELCTELESSLSASDYIERKDWAPMPTACVVDVMGNMRVGESRSLETFGGLCNDFCRKVSGICGKPERINLVFDSYYEGSTKDSERLRRQDEVPIEINVISSETPLPVDMSTFWGSNSNKTKLQHELRHYIKEKQDPLSSGIVVLSAVGVAGKTEMEPCISLKDGKCSPKHDLNVSLEEADVRLIIHINDAAKDGMKRVVVVSNDTDVLVLCLHFWNEFEEVGLEELWMRGGAGNTTRFIPIHILAGNLGQVRCKSLIAMHLLTGCDTTSKL